MYFFNLSGQILRDMWTHKMRSALALFGIVWGTIAVVLLLALGTGFSATNQKHMLGVVDGSIIGIPFKTSISYQGFPKGQPVNLKAQAIMDLKQNIPEIQTATPILLQKLRHLGIKGKHLSRYIYGVAASFAYLQKVNIANGGRFINKLDVSGKTFTVILGDQLKQQIFGTKPAIGKQLTLNHVKFTVVGVIKPPGKNMYNFFRNTAMIPYTTYINLFGNQTIQYFVAMPYPTADNKVIDQAIRTFLGHKYHFNPNDKIALNILDATMFYKFVRWFFLGLNIFLGICGALTLGVGSLGIANIMFLIVTERTREIGIRMALGAKTYHILGQIILESLVITGLGGFIGFLISYVVVTILQHAHLPEWLGKPTLSATVVIVTIIVLSLFGLFAGFFPARKAARMDPVEALGY